MKTLIIAATAALSIASAAYADASLTIDAYVIKETDADANYTLSAEGDFAFSVTGNTEALVGGELRFTEVGTSDVELSQWYVGARFNGNTYFTVGKQDDLWIDGLGRELDSLSLGEPVSGEHALIVGRDGETYAGAVFVGYDDVADEVTNVQIALQFGTPVAFASTVTGVVDYNRATEDFALGVAVDGTIGVIGTMAAFTYVDDAFAYEVGASYVGFTGWIGGTEDDTINYVGAGYSTYVREVELWTEVTYEIDADNTAVAAGVSFSF